MISPRADGDRLAAVAALQPGELLAVLLDQVGELGERPAALAGGPVRPALALLERRLRRGDGAIDVARARRAAPWRSSGPSPG